MSITTQNKCIISPMAWGNGAYILHKMIEKHIPNYKVVGYTPYYTIIPFSLPLAVPVKGADLIHTTPDYGLFFYSRKIPTVITVHHYMCDGKIDSYSTPLQKLHYRTDLKWFTKRSISLATVLTAVSHYSANHIKKALNLHQKIQVIYNGIDEAFFTPLGNKRKFSSVNVLFCGNLISRKGAHWLPSIAENLKKGIKIYYTSGLKRNFFRLKNKNINHLGRIPYETMPDVYQKHDILIAPSVHEGFGLAIAEAMSCGLPIVASNCSAIPELIDDGKGGFLCPVGDVKAFAEKINLLADSPKLRREMGEYNREKVEKYFTIDRMVKEYQDLFEEVLG